MKKGTDHRPFEFFSFGTQIQFAYYKFIIFTKLIDSG